MGALATGSVLPTIVEQTIAQVKATQAASRQLIRQGQAGITVAQATARLKAAAVDQAPAGVDNVAGVGQLICAASPTVTTQATDDASGAGINDSATLAGGPSPTGTITFNAFGPNNATCAGSPAFTSSPAVNGNGVYNSGNFSPVAAGAHRWVVTYNGNTNNLPATSPCNAANELSTVTVCATQPPPGTLPGNNIVIAAPGLATIGTAGNDVIYGTAGDDRIFGGGGDDIVFAGGGNDQVTVGAGRDSLCGGDGNDRLTGDGNDDLTGLGGNDRLIGGTGIDRLDGGDGTDTCTPGTDPTSSTVKCEAIV